MLDAIMVLIIASWFYKTAHERGQSKMLWVVAGLLGYFAGEFIVGWTLSGLIIRINPDLWFLQTFVIITAGVMGMFIVRFVLLTFWKEGQRVSAAE